MNTNVYCGISIIITYQYEYILIICMVFSGYISSLPPKRLHKNLVAKGKRWGISGKQTKNG